MKYSLALIPLVALLLTACFERDELGVNLPCDANCITITGTVRTDQNSTTPVENASIELGWRKPGIPIGKPGRLIATGLSDENGSYRFTFAPEAEELSSGKYYLQVAKSGFYDVTNAYYDIVSLDTTYQFDLHVASKAQLIITFKNFHPNTENDYFSVVPQFDNYGFHGPPISLFDAEGKQKNPWFDARDSSFNEYILFSETAGNQYTYFNILIKKDGLRLDLRDSLYIERNEIGVYEIEY